MAEHTLISWCDHTFNPWIGCAEVSPACEGCYARRLMDERLHRVEWGGVGKGAGTRSRTSAAYWRDLVAWDRKARADGTHPFVFGGSLMDPFDNAVDPSWRRDYFSLIRETTNLVMLLLTKRPELIVDMSEDAGGLPPNVALGTTAEDQKRWDHCVGHLVAAKALLSPLFAFVSCEPLLEAIDPRRAVMPRKHRVAVGFHPDVPVFDPLLPFADRRFKVDWVITGGESDQGPHKARPSHPQWFRRMRDACALTGTPYHHKQNGEWVSVSEVAGDGPHFSFADGATVRKIGKGNTGRTIDGVEHNDRPKVAA